MAVITTVFEYSSTHLRSLQYWSSLPPLYSLLLLECWCYYSASPYQADMKGPGKVKIARQRPRFKEDFRTRGKSDAKVQRGLLCKGLQGPWQGRRHGEDFSAALSNARCCCVLLNELWKFSEFDSLRCFPLKLRVKEWQVAKRNSLRNSVHAYVASTVFSSLDMHSFTIFCPHLLWTAHQYSPGFEQ